MRLPASQPTHQQASAAAHQTLLESSFPFETVSAIAKRDRYCRDHAYSIHKWWARRPPAVIRSLLLAAMMPASTSLEDFWNAFASDDANLAGRCVGDPFMGGATSLVEAARLGAEVVGIDVDPLAVKIASSELEALDVPAFRTEAALMLDHLRDQVGSLYPSGEGRQPLHYFWLRRGTCSDCGADSLLYRNLWLVRDKGLPGAVVRDHAGTAFCPDCRTLHHVREGQKQLRCCGRHRLLSEGTYNRARFTCPCCDKRLSNEAMSVGTLPRDLIAVEETVVGARRSLRAPNVGDYTALQSACTEAGQLSGLPGASLTDVDSGRPKSYGFETVADLFSHRQQVVFAAAFRWIRSRRCPSSIRQALELSVSNALGSNNLLCGYATDYGRLSSVFSGVRAYSMPVLSVELNPLHPDAGRGTLAMTLERMARSGRAKARRNRYDAGTGEVVPHSFATAVETKSSVTCRSADRPLLHPYGKFDAVITDPPYFDFIPYSDLSLLYRAWHEDEESELGGAPIYPVGDDPAADFAVRLGRAFKNVLRALKREALMAFTFHSSHEDAWSALEKAIKFGGFGVTAVFPVWADGRAGGHGHAGNCEWDLVFVCRAGTPSGTRTLASCDDWLRRISPATVEASDRRSMELGLSVANRLSL